ncbi:MAG: hypothetical protein IPG92_00625 [Flavobacteriales bacterium]|nr:hypothetical protein [Flavobacteriales bacterium]
MKARSAGHKGDIGEQGTKEGLFDLACGAQRVATIIGHLVHSKTNTVTPQERSFLTSKALNEFAGHG